MIFLFLKMTVMLLMAIQNQQEILEKELAQKGIVPTITLTEQQSQMAMMADANIFSSILALGWAKHPSPIPERTFFAGINHYVSMVYELNKYYPESGIKEFYQPVFIRLAKLLEIPELKPIIEQSTISIDTVNNLKELLPENYAFDLELEYEELPGLEFLKSKRIPEFYVEFYKSDSCLNILDRQIALFENYLTGDTAATNTAAAELVRALLTQAADIQMQIDPTLVVFTIADEPPMQRLLKHSWKQLPETTKNIILADPDTEAWFNLWQELLEEQIDTETGTDK